MIILILIALLMLAPIFILLGLMGVAVEGKTYHIDVRDMLPGEYKFKRWANKLK